MTEEEPKTMPKLVTLPREESESDDDHYDTVIVKKKKKKKARKIYVVEATSSEGEAETPNFMPNQQYLEKQRILAALERQRNNRR